MIAPISALIATASIGAALAATPIKNIALPPSSEWKVDKAIGDKVDMADVEGCLRVTFDVNVNSLHQVGNSTFKQNSFSLMLPKPIPLSGSAGRILFESLGGNEGLPTNTLRVLPMIRDSHGETLIYVPVRYPHLNATDAKWGRWMTPYFYCGEAGAATQDIYEAEGGDHNAWPDGALTFIGFRIEARLPEFGHRIGSVVLDNVQVGEANLGFEKPYAYADSLFNKSGTYKVATQVRNSYQGLPVREDVRQVSFDQTSLHSAKQRIELNLGPDDNYWIRYQAADNSGSAVTDKTLRFQVEGSPDKETLKPINPEAAPPVGCMRINPGQHAGGVYAAGEPLRLTVRVFGAAGSSMKLAWTVSPISFPNVLEKGETTVLVESDKPYRDVPVTIAGDDGHDAYRALFAVTGPGGAPLDSTQYTFGRTTDFSTPRHSRTGKLLDRDYVKNGAYVRVTYLPTPVMTGVGYKSEDNAVADFDARIDQISKITRYITYCIDLRDFEVLPGVFDFSLLDRFVDNAADRGCTLTIRIGHVDQDGLLTWMKYSRQRGFDGMEIFENYYGGFAVADESYTARWLAAYRALYDRYKTNPGFQGYYLMQPAGETTVEDKPWQGLVAGYEKPTQDAFRAYVRDTLGLSLDAVNQRWNTSFRSWSDVSAPMPYFQSGTTPDLRMWWVDFCKFKTALDTDGWFPRAAKAIRQFDPDHVVMIYGGSSDPAKLAGIADYLHNGGNHFLQGERSLVDTWRDSGLGWITEPHHPHRWAAYGDPGERGWVLDWSVYVMMAQSEGGGANMHLYYDPNIPTLPGHFGGAWSYDRFEKFRPMLDELQTMKLTSQAPQIATLQDPYTLYCKHRTTFGPREQDLKRWFELLRADGLAKEDFQAAHASQYKLILPNIIDEVMSSANIDQVAHLVRDQGARAVIAANTGKYCPERGKEPFQLLRALGIQPPAGAYIDSDPSVNAAVSSDSPLFKAGATVAFYSLANLQKDLQSDEVRTSFWAWPYRFIPQTDYFGYYRDNKQTNGQILARFPSGGVAISLHNVGKGQVLVFWGTPDYRVSKLAGFMSRVADWAGVTDPAAGNPLPLMLEGDSEVLGRHYALIYNETPGAYTQRLPTAPDGKWFIDDIVSDQRLGIYTGKELREKGLDVKYFDGYSPLKVYRFIPAGKIQADWVDKYRTP